MSEFGLCGECWREMSMIGGLVCDACGLPLPGENPDGAVYCDTCLIAPKPWQRGRAALLYKGTARRMVLALKHGDRHDLVKPMAGWMAVRAKELIRQDTLIAPVPLHWRRLFRRRYNQAAMLAESIAKICSVEYCPDLLRRRRATVKQDGLSRAERYENQNRAFLVPDNRKPLIKGRSVLLVDDVMTSGATLSACTEACFAQDASLVNVLVLARVARDT